MNIFNSLGSNYNFKFVLTSLFTGNNAIYKKELETFLEKKYGGQVILLYKGREVIRLVLKSLNLPEGSFVAINGFTCFAVYEAIKKAGLNVEYLDIEKSDLNFSPSTLEEKLTGNPKIKVVIIQNTLGYPCQIEQIADICKNHNLILIEDLAHSLGTRYPSGILAGSIGDLVVLSFSQDKMIDAVSCGALIKRTGAKPFHLKGGTDLHLRDVSERRQLIDRLYPFFTYVIRKTYSFGVGKVLHFILKNLHLLSGPMDRISNNLHQLPSWYCHLVNLEFANLQNDLTHRSKVASIYSDLISPKVISKTITQQIDLSSNLRFPIFVNNRSSLIKYLAKQGIYVSDIWYDAPIAPKKYLQATDYLSQCPNAELAASEILNLPTHKQVSPKDAVNISQLINQWLKLQ